MVDMSNEWAPVAGETPIDPSHLKNKTIKTRAELNAAEAENIRKAFVKYLAARPSRRLAPFDFSWFCKLHGEMFGDVWLWAGQLRTADLNIGVPWHQVSAQLMALTGDISHWETVCGFSPLEIASRLHHGAVVIHPFPNGNGRWARMLANTWLRQHNETVVRWPEHTISNAGDIRDEYLATLRAADGGQHEPLLELHRRFAEE